MGKVMRITIIFIAIILLVAGCNRESEKREELALDPRPNILLIVADDLGYGDIGFNGSEIETPNLDVLANSGMRFDQFHTLPTCSPTRSMLLTGVDNHLNGLGTMKEDKLPHHEGLSGYQGYLNESTVTVAELLRDVGYQTYMSGKWHLGMEEEGFPSAKGFSETFALLNGGANHFNDLGTNSNVPKASYTEDGVPIKRPEGYSSDLFTDKLLGMIEGGEKQSPFFAYLSFTAPHWPVQAPQDVIRKYEETYSNGWDDVRSKRFDRMKSAGLVPQNLKLPARLDDVPAWSTLSEREKKNEARKMAIYAAMVDNLDANIGRVMQHLESQGKLDNTIVVFMSDNGADPYDRTQRNVYQEYFSATGVNNEYENMGAADSYLFQGLGWAQVSSVHLKHYKFLLSEGGTRSPLLVYNKGLVSDKNVLDQFASVADIAPTLLELAGAQHPGTEYQGKPVFAMRGRSLVDYMSGRSDRAYAADEAVAFELFGNASIYMGEWKGVRLREPWEPANWKLYNLANDPSELIDMSLNEPEILKVLLDKYRIYEEDNGVVDEPSDVTSYPAVPRYQGISN
jgi:arylsulfatase A-like enzyme|tara:strand:+ start:2038 stop:3741 length:1704 start_codon:yes stop_codon:yes gene_type:complete